MYKNEILVLFFGDTEEFKLNRDTFFRELPEFSKSIEAWFGIDLKILSVTCDLMFAWKGYPIIIPLILLLLNSFISANIILGKLYSQMKFYITSFCSHLTYRSGMLNSNTVNSKFHLIRSFFEIFARFLSFHV